MREELFSARDILLMETSWAGFGAAESLMFDVGGGDEG